MAKKARKPTSSLPGEETSEVGVKKVTQKTLDSLAPEVIPESPTETPEKPKAKPRKRAKSAATSPVTEDKGVSADEPSSIEVGETPKRKRKKKITPDANSTTEPAAVGEEPAISEPSNSEDISEEPENPDQVDGDPEAEEKVRLEYVVDEAENRHKGDDEAREKIKQIIPKKFWMIDPWRTLLDPSLAKDAEVLNYDLSKLIRDFFDMMLKEEIVDFRISGIATYSAAKMHHWKILETIKEEEKAEEQRQRERLERTIPKAMSQPLRESRKIATADDLVGAMRRAIIETMQKREKLRLRRVVREQKRAIIKQTRIKGQLPKEFLRQFTDMKMTVEDMLANWLEKIKTSASLSNNGLTTLFDLWNVIKAESKTKLEERIKLIHLFQSMCFLANQSSIFLEQDDLFKDIVITPHKKNRSLDEFASEQSEETEELNE
ncbi:MAG: hypothetical protein RBG13Loki_1317 [Promethearchaeota archaeon CR_4]|nr:MAG: hypothetical protein RBG13Loki_1317 [Candidatus Lokiarchaeota archaeon CR_4]